MQFALTLEHAEVALYTEALDKFGADAFEREHFPQWVRNRIVQIGNHEMSHVALLTAALEAANATVPEPCNYTFPFTDASAFVDLSQAVEGVGSAAYTGALPALNGTDSVQAAAAIMAIEQRQAGWLNSAVRKHAAWDGEFETGINPSGAFSLAQAFFVECPATNPALPITLFPALNITQAPTSPGDEISVDFAGAKFGNNTFLAFMSGLNTTFVGLDENGTALVPAELLGTVFIGVVKNDNATVSDSTMLSGFNMLHFEFDSHVRGIA